MEERGVIPGQDEPISGTRADGGADNNHGLECGEQIEAGDAVVFRDGKVWRAPALPPIPPERQFRSADGKN